ncbi:hypothetical protein [Coleofasciculus sp.]|uniref:hypothetical protein n=1 Tax=Coleofasciculus sp. TaxID=3100458 RepID=UPI003A3E4D51
MFDTLNQQTAQAISAAENLVEQLQQQLKEAQNQLNKLYQQQQLEQTAQGTVQTALDMAYKAYRALETAYPNNPKAIEEFEEAFLALRNSRRPEFKPAKPTVNQDNYIDFVVTEKGSNGNGNGNGHHSGDTSQLKLLLPIDEKEKGSETPTKTETEILSVDELKILPRQTLQELCARYSVQSNGNRLHLAQRLKGKVKRCDLTKPAVTKPTEIDFEF